MRGNVAASTIVFSFFCVACDDGNIERSKGETESVAVVEAPESKLPRTFVEALDALDRRSSSEEREAFRNDEVELGLFHKITGMQLRNEWGLWKGSELKTYFSERGIAHADWISSAIIEEWIERLKTGTVDEAAIFAKYAETEREWRAWNATLGTEEDDGSDGHSDVDDPFSSLQEAEQNAEPQTRPRG